MANEEQLAILRQGVDVWNQWRELNPEILIDLSRANLERTDLSKASLFHVDLFGANLGSAKLTSANLSMTDLSWTRLNRANLDMANLAGTNLSHSELYKTNFGNAWVGYTIFGSLDLSQVIPLTEINHRGPSTIGTDTIVMSKGKISEIFLRGCGLSNWEIEMAKLYTPDISNEKRNQILYKVYDLQASQAIQISPLFISYSHADKVFVDKVETKLNQKGVRFWRDIHNMKAGRIETQIDQAISQNRIVLLILSEHSLKSDWVEHEVRKAREQEKGTGRDVLCPIALDDSWKDSRWPARVMEQIKEYNILDFSGWQDDVKFEGMFRKLIDGLKLFYKG